MSTILIRDMPDEVHKALVLSAERNRRSKEKQALFLIETGLRRKRNPAELRQEAKKIHAQFKGGPVSMADVLKWTEAEH